MRKFLDANVICSTLNMKKDEWLKKRKCGIGGSDCASVLNMNPYKSMTRVYIDKLSGDVEVDNTNFKMELGTKLEDFVAKEFSTRTNKKVGRINGILKNPKYPFAIANIDRCVYGESSILECKVTSSYMKKEWEKQVPIHYELQCMHYLAVTGASICYVAVLIGNEDLIIHKIERDEQTIDYILGEEEKFWNEYILGEKIPMPDGSEDYSKYLKEKYKFTKNESINIYLEEDKLSRYDELKKLIKELDFEKKYIEQFIQNKMGEHELAYINDRKVTWKNQIRNSIDTKKLKNEHPQIINEYTKTTNSRVFKIH